MSLFETTIDTTFLCFLVDEEYNKGGHMLASEGLRKIVDQYEKQSIDESKKMNDIRNKRNKGEGNVSAAPPSSSYQTFA